LFWHIAAYRGLIDSVGGMEWRHRHAGTELVSKAWLDKYDQLEQTEDFRKAVAIVIDVKKTKDGLCENCSVETPGYPPDYCLTYDFLCFDCDQELYLKERSYL